VSWSCLKQNPYAPEENNKTVSSLNYLHKTWTPFRWLYSLLTPSVGNLCTGCQGTAQTHQYTITHTYTSVPRDKEMAHSIQSPAVDVFSLPPPKKTNLTVVPLSASSGSFVRGGSPYVFPLSDPPCPPTHTRHIKQGFWSSPIEALQSNSSSKQGEGKKRRLLDFV
jgi:hypothetical protein